jgi:ATP-dependent exoDNAse (exonuclease V) beta subunit
VAKELARLDLPVILPRTGLLATAEGRVALAGLRLWVDPGDNLALAELARLIHYPDRPEEWLAQLLERPGQAAFRDLPEAAALIQLAKEEKLAGVLSALDQVLDVLGLRELCLRLGDSAARLANLEALRKHAAQYLELSAAEGGGATVAGLVIHLQELQESGRDDQGRPPGQAAVTVTTWHGAKGLEWPLVILHEADKSFDRPPLGVKAVGDREGFDLQDPLGGRWVRYLPFPYDPRHKDTPFQRRLATTPAAQAEADQETRQALRLLYVGWTRARDRVILAGREGRLAEGLLGLLQDDRGEPLLSEPQEDRKAFWADREIIVQVRRDRKSVV